MWKKGDTNYVFPPKRTKREWNEIYRTKIRQLEAIAWSYLGKTPWGGG